MPFLTVQQADVMLRPFFQDLGKVVHSAWGDWRANQVAPQMQHKRVRANIVWNQLIAHARRQFDGRTDVRVEVIKDWNGVLIKDSIFIRMKKGSEKLYSRNYPTQSALAFHDQIQDLFGGIYRLELLYILDRSEMEIDRIVLIQRHKQSVVWCIELDDKNGLANNVLPLLPQGPIPMGTTTVADRILKPKVAKNDKQHNGTSEDT